MERRGRPAVIQPDVRQIFLGAPARRKPHPFRAPRSSGHGTAISGPRRALSRTRGPLVATEGASIFRGDRRILLLLDFRRRLLALVVELAKLFFFAHLQEL